MITYHGTSPVFAKSIVGPPTNVDVTIGGGELGRGFYTGENVALAAAWAKGRYHKKGVVIKLDMQDDEFIKLNIKTINNRRILNRLWKRLQRNREEYDFLFNFDVICAPFALIDFSYQYKFESNNAQTKLNNNKATKMQIL